jgi:hypothetical protein
MYRASASASTSTTTTTAATRDGSPPREGMLGGITIGSVPGIDGDWDRVIPAAGSGIRVVSFDLDDTIWRTSPTISDANDALASHLREAFGIDPGGERCEARMGTLFEQFPDRYAGGDLSRAAAEANSIGGEEGGEAGGVVVARNDGDEDLLSLERYGDQQLRRRVCPEFVADRAMILVLLEVILFYKTFNLS